MLQKSKYKRSLSLFYVNACLRLDATMNGFETKFQTNFMHVKIKMKQTQNPMYNVSFWFSKVCAYVWFMYQPCDDKNKSSQALFHRCLFFFIPRIWSYISDYSLHINPYGRSCFALSKSIIRRQNLHTFLKLWYVTAVWTGQSKELPGMAAKRKRSIVSGGNKWKNEGAPVVPNETS